jgi:hypothetical protein
MSKQNICITIKIIVLVVESLTTLFTAKTKFLWRFPKNRITKLVKLMKMKNKIHKRKKLKI